MHKLLNSIFGGLLILGTQSSFASNWVELSKGDDMTIYIDNSSLAPVKNYKKIWVKFDYKTPKEVKGEPAVFYDSVMHLWVFDCKERTSTTTQRILYKSGDVLHAYQFPLEASQFSDVPPDTIAESVMGYVCYEPQPKPKTK